MSLLSVAVRKGPRFDTLRVVQLIILEYKLFWPLIMASIAVTQCDRESRQKEPRGKGAKFMELPLDKPTLLSVVLCPHNPSTQDTESGECCGLRPDSAAL